MIMGVIFFFFLAWGLIGLKGLKEIDSKWVTIYYDT